VPSTLAHSVGAKVLELDRAWGQAYVQGDIDVIDRTLAPDWRGWLDTGGSDKATELAEFKAGKNRSLENIIDNTHVRVYGNTAGSRSSGACPFPRQNGRALAHLAHHRCVRQAGWPMASGRFSWFCHSEPMTNGMVGHTEVIETRLFVLVLGSLSAVSEAPTSEDLPFRCAVYGRFRYSDLKEAAPRTMGFVCG
jgi:hypothetical protein